MSSLLIKKHSLVVRYGYAFGRYGSSWICYDSRTPHGFWYESNSLEETIEHGFMAVSAAIYYGLLYGKMTPEEAGEYFKSSDLPTFPYIPVVDDFLSGE